MNLELPVPVGLLLREWRAARRLSQLDLALDANISTRHLSCIETGKAQPSRPLLMRLADTLDMPLRERNALLHAAGYAASFPETRLDTPAMQQVNTAIECILAHQDPYPAFLMNRHWDILGANASAVRMNGFLLDGRASPHANMMRHVFDPSDLRARLSNWDDVAGNLIRHLHALVAGSPTDDKARALLDEVLAYPDVPSRWRVRDLDATPPAPLLTTEFRHRGQHLRFFSTITTFGTPRDITVDELHIECCFPMDEATAAFCRQLADAPAI